MLSSTFRTSAFNCTVLPETVKSPVIVTSPEIVPPTLSNLLAILAVFVATFDDTVSILEFADTMAAELVSIEF